MSLERDFGRQHAPDERNQAAEELRASRKKLKTDWSQWNAAEVSQSGKPEIQEGFDALKRDFIGRLFETEKFLQRKEAFRGVIEVERRRASDDVMRRYHERLDGILAKTSLTPDEQEKYLSEEAVMAMDLPDYLTMMKRLSGYYVSHVTRYGVREQTFVSTGGGHSVGMGEFMDGFTPALESGRLNSFFTNVINETEYAKGVLSGLIKRKIEEAGGGTPDKEAVIEEVLQELMRWDAHDMHPADRTTTHFASNDIAARYYGAEVGYDIYFYYPAEVIAKNYRHEWQNHTNITAEHTDWYNDVGVWNEGKGVPIDAGVVCIPEDVRVDKETGSQYVLDGEKKPMVNPVVAEHIEFAKNNRDLFYETFRKLDAAMRSYGHARQHDFFSSAEFRQAAADLKFPDVKTLASYVDFMGLLAWPDLEFFYQFRERNYYIMLPRENLIKSKEFWDAYFQKNPNKRPSKVMYYSWQFQGAKNYDIIKSGGYDGLYEAKKFGGTQDLPNYSQFLEATKQEMRAMVDKTYDAILSSESN